MMPREKTMTEGTESPSLLRPVWEIIKTIFTGAVLLAAVAMMIFTVVSVTTFDQNDRNLFGYKAFIVRTASMSATDFDAGDLILIREVDPAALEAGDIISFLSEDPNTYGEVFTHKIRSLITDENGNPAFITYGTTTGTDDAVPVTYDRILGKYQFALKGVGSFFTFLKTVPGYICCILIPFMTLIIIQGVNSIRLFRQYRDEQMEEMEAKRQKDLDEMSAERERLEAERLAAEKKLEELKKLQAELEDKEQQE